jgi:hypothetical protein
LPLTSKPQRAILPIQYWYKNYKAAEVPLTKAIAIYKELNIDTRRIICQW